MMNWWIRAALLSATCVSVHAQSLLGVQATAPSTTADVPLGTVSSSASSRYGAFRMDLTWGSDGYGAYWVKPKITGPMDHIRTVQFFLNGDDPDGQWHKCTEVLTDVQQLDGLEFGMGKPLQVLAQIITGPTWLNRQANAGPGFGRTLAAVADDLDSENVAMWVRVPIPPRGIRTW